MCLNNNIKAGLFFIGACLLCVSKVYSQDKDIPQEYYKASGIPDSLKEDANSVIRYSLDEVKIKGPGKAVIKHHSLVTILNEKGDKDAVIVFLYNRKYDTYSSIDVRVYDESGKAIKKYHKSDMYDGAASSESTLVSDERFLGLKHAITHYPETVELSYEEDLSSFIDFDPWVLQHGEQSLQNETYKIIVAPDLGFRYKCQNISVAPVKAKEGEFEIYNWDVSNRKAFKIEEGAKGWRVIPSVNFAVNKFNCYGYPGDISTWQDYGKWVYDLNKDVCTLTPERTAVIKKMTDSIKTDREKAKFLYEYLQKSMRYVSVQLGIGGYKPFDANFVDQKKYGDCKALANYMYALLKAVDIKSYWAVIQRGINGYAASPDFPFNSFNHEILCVPFKTDTAWLDCTDTYQPFGTLDLTTLNRNALLITEDGGKLVNTPRSIARENQLNSEVHIELQPDGGAKAHVKVLSTGGYRQMFIDITSEKVDEQKEFLLRYFNIKQPSLFDFKTSPNKAEINELNMDLEYDKFCDVLAGDKQFYRPRVFDLWTFTAPITEKRKSDYYFDHPLQKSCVTTIDVPAGFEVETLPVNTTLKFTYGNYELSYLYNKEKNQVVSTAKFILNNHVIPAAKYTEMQQYMDAVAKAQNKKLVIKKKA